MERFIVLAGSVVAVLTGVLVLSFLLSWPVMMLWNGCLVDAIPGVHEISWLQAWGLNILCRILFNKPNSTSKE